MRRCTLNQVLIVKSADPIYLPFNSSQTRS
jgi:hypothetical protein